MKLRNLPGLKALGLLLALASANTHAQDSTPPAAVADLGSSLEEPYSITLSWTAPGDDGNSGTATSYDIRYSTTAITNDTDFNNATEVTGEPTPSVAGSSESYEVTSLNPETTYYFALKTTDELANTSALSNVYSVSTAGAGAGGGAPSLRVNLGADAGTGWNSYTAYSEFSGSTTLTDSTLVYTNGNTATGLSLTITRTDTNEPFYDHFNTIPLPTHPGDWLNDTAATSAWGIGLLTDSNMTYEVTGLPAGTYDIEAYVYMEPSIASASDGSSYQAYQLASNQLLAGISGATTATTAQYDSSSFDAEDHPTQVLRWSDITVAEGDTLEIFNSASGSASRVLNAFIIKGISLDLPRPTIDTQPQNASINEGQNTTLTVAATTSGGTLSYQWYQGVSGDTSSPVGTDSSSYTTATLSETIGYWVQVTDDNGSTDSDTAVVTVQQSGTAERIVFVGNSYTNGYVAPTQSYNTANVTDLNGSGYGGVPGIFEKIASDSGYPVEVGIESVNGSTLLGRYPIKVDLLTNPTWDRYVLQARSQEAMLDGRGDGASASVFNTTVGDWQTAILNANPQAKIWLYAPWAAPTYVGAGEYYSEAEGTETFLNEINVAYEGAYTSLGLDGWVPVGQAFSDAAGQGLTDLLYTDDHHANAAGSYLAAVMMYRQLLGGDPRLLPDGPGSAPADLGLTTFQTDTIHQLAYDFVYPTPQPLPPSILTQPADTSIQTGETATLTVTAVGSSLSYQWYEGTSGTITTPVSGATSASMTTPTLGSEGTFDYWVRVTNPNGTADSQTATVTVAAPGSGGQTSWEAYHNTEALVTNPNESLVSKGNAADTAYNLVKYADGTAADGATVTVSYTGSWTMNTSRAEAVMPNSGTDAHTLFDGKLALSGRTTFISTSSSPEAIIRFENLDPSSTYAVRLTLNRGLDYKDTQLELIDASSSAEASSSGIQAISTTAVAINSNNTTNGYVAGWDAITPSGSGGTSFAVRVVPGPSQNFIYLPQLISLSCAAPTSGTSYAFDGTLADYFTADATYTSDPQTSGSLTQANSRLEYAVSGPDSTEYWTEWTATTLPKDTDWSAQGVFNIDALSPGDHTHVSLGMMLTNSVNDTPLRDCDYAELYLKRYPYALTPSLVNRTSLNAEAADNGSPLANATEDDLPVQPVLLRMNYVAATETLRLARSLDSGNTWVTVLTSDLSTWDTGGHFRLLIGGNTAVFAVTAGTVWVDNMAVTTEAGASTPTPVAITQEPTDDSVTYGGSTTLSVTVSGDDPTYQWYLGTSGDTATPIGGATAASYTTPNLTATTSYWVQVTGSNSVDSQTATVTVEGASGPVIQQEPADQSIYTGYTATFSIDITGTGTVTYQWYQGTSGDPNSPINGATSETYTTPPLTSPANYWVRVTDGLGSTDSATASVTLLATLNAGQPDTTFDFGSDNDKGPNGDVYDAIVQSDGKPVIVGIFDSISHNTGSTSVGHIARLNTDGRIDPSFNPGTGADDDILDIAQLPDGSLLVVGYFDNYNSTPRSGIALLHADGSLNTSFNPVGGLGGGDGYTITLQADGKVLIGGDFDTYGGHSVNNLVRLHADLSYDSSFTAAVPVNGSNSVKAIAVQSDGKVVYSENFTDSANVYRLNPDGSADATFNSPVENGTVEDLEVLSNDKILVCGDFDEVNSTARHGIARLNADGSLDTTFAPTDTESNWYMSIYVQTDGRIMATGRRTIPANGLITKVIRYNADGSTDATFSTGEMASQNVRFFVPTPDGRFGYIGGFYESFYGTYPFDIDHFARIYAPQFSDAFHDSAANSGLTGEDANPEAAPQGDNVPNIVKYALGITLDQPVDTTQLPSATLQPTTLDFEFRRQRSDLTYIIEASDTLEPGSWAVISTNPGNAGEDVTVQVPTDSLDRRFVRLRVEQ